MKLYIALIAFGLSLSSYAQSKVKVVANVNLGNVVRVESRPAPRPHYHTPPPRRRVHHHHVSPKRRHHHHAPVRMHSRRHHR